MLGFLIGLVYVLLWLTLAIIMLGALWCLLVTLPSAVFRSTRDSAITIARNLPPPRLPDWLLLSVLVVLSGLVCMLCNAGLGIVALGAGAVLLYGKQRWQLVYQRRWSS